ncbi:MAG TPA: hypothetical protein VFN97_20165 [Actinospica sp.]|nr:hypothetical protein [Actinospica sp.]
MRHVGSDSWSIRVDLEQHSSNMLYVRDAAGLTGPADYVVPPLAPAVELRADLAPFATLAAAEDWERWWSAHLADLGRAARVDLTPAGPPPEPGTDLRALFNAVIDEANAWWRERKIEFVHRTTRPDARRAAGRAGDTVARIERELGRTSAPFELEVKLLPMDGRWGRRLRPTLVVASEQLWLDPQARDEFLDPIVRALV